MGRCSRPVPRPQVTRRLELAGKAFAAIEIVAESYDVGRTGLGRSFRAEFDRLAAGVLRHLAMYEAVSDRYRRALLPKCPFGVIYRVKPDTVRVVAVLPTKSHPRRLTGAIAQPHG